MPLLDHFHPPLSTDRHGESVHAAWCGSLADDLNRRLPPGYFAEEMTHAGAGVEIDVPTFERSAPVTNGGLVEAVPLPTWTPPPPAFSVAAAFAADFEVRVFSQRGGPTLVAAIELVSPRNKDRREARQGFANKCASYLYQGVSLIVVDVVTDRHANLHDEIMRLLNAVGPWQPSVGVRLYTTAFRLVRRAAREEIDVWGHRLEVAGVLPVLPLTIHAELTLAVDLEAAYQDACRRRRVP